MSEELYNSTGYSTAETLKDEIALPPERKVVIYNDDFTTMEFVVDVLVSIFNKSPQAAHELMLQIHEKGHSVVGIYTLDVAVSRTNLAVHVARKNGFPLRVEVE